MKKFWLIIAIIIVIAGLGGVFLRDGHLPVTSGNKIKVAASLPLVLNLVERVGGKEVAVTSIIKGTACSHEYEPTSGDLKQVARAEVFVKMGLGFDIWVEKLLESAGRKETLLIDVSQGVTAFKDEEDHAPGEEADHHGEHADYHEVEHEVDTSGENHHHHEFGNPHYWGNPDHVKIMARNICDGLSRVRPDRKEYFAQNLDNWTKELEQVAAELKQKVDGLPGKQLVSYSAAFPYFLDYFGFETLETVELSCEQEVSPKRLAEVAKTMKQKQVPVLIGEAVYPELPVSLAKETGARLILLWPATDESGDYLKTLRNNVEKMVTE